MGEECDETYSILGNLNSYFHGDLDPDRDGDLESARVYSVTRKGRNDIFRNFSANPQGEVTNSWVVTPCDCPPSAAADGEFTDDVLVFVPESPRGPPDREDS